MPSHKELRKKSDEHKAILAQKCVDLLMRKPATLEEATDVSVCGSNSLPAYTQQLLSCGVYSLKQFLHKFSSISTIIHVL